jgi:hypothetical protein
MYMLKAFALPAESEPPMRVAATSHTEGIPRSARIMTGAVVTNNSSMTRGFVSAM